MRAGWERLLPTQGREKDAHGEVPAPEGSQESGTTANRIIGEHFMGKGHLYCILRTSLELKRTQWGNEEPLHSFFGCCC